MFAVSGLALLGLFLGQTSPAPDISGKWTGEKWGDVVLELKDSGVYEGTYSDTLKGEPGKLQLKWSQREGRFNGTWQESNDCHGKISLQRVKDEIRGAWSTIQQPAIDAARPELADLVWVRPSSDPRGILVKLRLDAEKHSAKMLRKNVGFNRLSIMGSGVKGTINGKDSVNLVAVFAHQCRLVSFKESEKGYFEATFFVPQEPSNDGSNLDLSQSRISQLQEQGVEFWLDHHRDQFPDNLNPLEPKEPQNNDQDNDIGL